VSQRPLPCDRQVFQAGEWLNCQARDCWDTFEDVLDATAECKWSNLIHGVANAQKTRGRFDTHVDNLLHKYAQGDNPRDVSIENIKDE